MINTSIDNGYCFKIFELFLLCQANYTKSKLAGFDIVGCPRPALIISTRFVKSTIKQRKVNIENPKASLEKIADLVGCDYSVSSNMFSMSKAGNSLTVEPFFCKYFW